MSNFNKTLLIGTLTKSPELSYLPNQTAVCKINLAVNRTWSGKDGQKKEEVCFIECQSFGPQAETINKYMLKGKQILVEGHLKQDIWTDKTTGAKKSKHYVVIETFQFLGGKSDGKKDDYQEPEDVEPKGLLDEESCPF